MRRTASFITCLKAVRSVSKNILCLSVLLTHIFDHQEPLSSLSLHVFISVPSLSVHLGF